MIMAEQGGLLLALLSAYGRLVRYPLLQWGVVRLPPLIFALVVLQLLTPAHVLVVMDDGDDDEDHDRDCDCHDDDDDDHG